MIVIDDDDNPVPTTPFAPRFTAEEDGELILLKERVGGPARWDSITDEFNRKFPQYLRSSGSLRSRYNDFLQDDTSRRPGNGGQRQRAIDALRRRGIELQADDSISDSSSGEADDDDESSEEDDDDNDDPE